MDQQNAQPSPVWEGTQEGGSDRHHSERGQGAPDQPVQGRGAPAPGGRAAGWGTTTDQHQVPGSGTGSGSGSGWGAPQPYPPSGSSTGRPAKWTGRKGLLVGGAVVAVAAAAGAGAYAAGSSGTGAATGNAPGAGVPGQAGTGGQNGMTGPGAGGTDGGMNAGMGGMGGGGMGGGPGGLGMGMAGLNAAIHSEYVVLQDSGYVTMAGQAGTVSSVSTESLTVKSEDGFTRTYAVSPDVQVSQGMRQRGGTTGSTLSLSNVTSGTTVRVTALKDGDNYTAQSIQLSAAGTTAAPGSGATGSGTTTN
ncbi:MAG: hypothetical protein HOQ06_07635 [Pseudarthrobacter sp.]|nr:hypothetical protein [Pseudarthrobacter sp.]